MYAEDARSKDSANWIAWTEAMKISEGVKDTAGLPILQADIPWPLAGDNDPLALQLPCKTTDGGM